MCLFDHSARVCNNFQLSRVPCSMIFICSVFLYCSALMLFCINVVLHSIRSAFYWPPWCRVLRYGHHCTIMSTGEEVGWQTGVSWEEPCHQLCDCHGVTTAYCRLWQPHQVLGHKGNWYTSCVCIHHILHNNHVIWLHHMTCHMTMSHDHITCTLAQPPTFCCFVSHCSAAQELVACGKMENNELSLVQTISSFSKTVLCLKVRELC